MSLGVVTADHSSFQVRTGMMNGAVQFFRQIRWKEIPAKKVSGVWGQARFVCPPDPCGHIFQLTELADGDPNILETQENHIAIHPSAVSPQQAAALIMRWAIRAGIGEGASAEPANAEGTKWFVYLPALFKFGIELV